MLQLVSLEEGLDLLLAKTRPLDRTTAISLPKAQGLISAEQIAAKIDNPPFDRSPLDGFAFRSSDSACAALDNPARLKVAGTIYAGKAPAPLGAGQALKIMTGAPMPEGSDCVAPKEVVKDLGQEVLIFQPYQKWENFIFKGEDIKKGEFFVHKGDKLDYAHLGMLAAMGIGRVKVYKPPKICLITVGDELVEVGTPLDPGQIYNSNGILLAARLADYGMKVAKPVAIGDDPAKVALCLEKNLEQADIVLTTGSVSVGDKDVMAEALNILGVSVDIKGLDFKPASAFMTGEYKSKRIFCLSGNPFAALATLELIVRPVLAKFSQQPSLEPKRCLALANEAMPVSRTKVRRFLRGRLSELSGGLRVVKVPLGQSSGRLFSLIGCNCLVDLPKNGPIPSPGTQVKVVDLEITP